MDIVAGGLEVGSENGVREVRVAEGLGSGAAVVTIRVGIGVGERSLVVVEVVG